MSEEIKMPTYAYTTYDASVNPVNCCVHIEVFSSSNVRTHHVHRFASANTFVSHEGTWYYISYDPKESNDGRRCCVWTTRTEADASGTMRTVKDEILCCGDRVLL